MDDEQVATLRRRVLAVGLEWAELCNISKELNVHFALHFYHSPDGVVHCCEPILTKVI